MSNKLSAGRLARTTDKVGLKTAFSEYGQVSDMKVITDRDMGRCHELGNITERKQAEKALRESEAKYRAVFEKTNDAIYLLGENHFVAVNPKFTELFGVTEKEVCSPDFDFITLVAPESRELIKERKKQLDAGEDINPCYEFVALSKDGQKRPVEVSVSYIPYNGNLLTLGVVHDITRRKRAEEALIKAYEKLEERVKKRTADLEKANAQLRQEIAERKRAEEALRKSEEWYRFLAENAADVIWTTDMNWKCTYINPATTNLRGYTPEEVTTQNWADVLTPESLEVAMNAFAEELAKEKQEPKNPPWSKTLELEMKCKDGSTVWTEVSASFLRDKDNKPSGILGISRNISERKRAETKLKQYKFMVESAHDVIFFKDLESRYVIANKKTLEAFGLPPDQVIGKNDYELMPDKGEARKNIEDDKVVFRTQKPKELVKNMTRADGKEFWFQAIKVPQYDCKGNLIGLVGIARDISELKHTEDALRESEERFRSLVETTSDWIWEVDQNGVYTYASPKIGDLLGYEPEEIIGKTPFDLMPPDEAERIGVEFQDIAASKRSFADLENANLHKDGRRVILETSGVPILGTNGNLMGYRGVDRDITDRKRAEEALRISKQELILTLDATTDAIWKWTFKTNEMVFSPRFYIMLGYAPGDFPGNFETWKNLIHPDDLENTLGVVKKYLASKPDQYRNKFRMRTKSGDYRWILMRGTVVERDERGAPVRMIGSLEDINERKLAKDALRDSENKFRALVERSSDIILLTDRSGQPIYVSPSIKTILGYEPRKVIGKPMSVLFSSSETLKKIRKALNKNRQGQSVDFMEVTLRGREGQNVIFDTHSTPIFQGEKFVGAQIVLHDITDRKRAQKAIQRLSREIELTLDASNTALDIIDPDFNIRYVSPGRRKVFGDPTGKKCYEYFSNQSCPVSGCSLKKALERKETIVSDVTIGDKYYMVSTVPFEERPGEWLVAEVSVDITKRKRAEEDLRESEETFRALAENSHDTIMRFDRQCRHLYVNPIAESQTNIPAEEFIGKTHAQLGFPQDLVDRWESAIQKVFDTKEANRIEFKLPSDVWIDWLLIPEQSPDGEVKAVLTSARDITERKRAEEEKATREEQLRQQEKLKSIGTLASGVAHEINNPLNAIMHFAELIELTNDKSKPESPPVGEYTQKIISESERVAAIVKNLLSFARQEKKGHDTADIVDIIRKSTSLIQAVLRKDQVTLDVDIPEGLPNIKCHSQQIQQVIMNLLTNARDALNQRYPKYHKNKIIKVSAKLFQKERKNWVRITVEDRGTGIDNEIIDRIFDPFFTTKGRDEGTGLGLSISYGIVKTHKGELTVESLPGKYARFHMDLREDNGWKLP